MKADIIKILQRYNVVDCENCAEDIILAVQNKTTSTKKATPEQSAMFNEFRLMYSGVKRGNETEFENFRRKHRDWEVCLSKLKVALIKEIAHRGILKKENKFVPEWKNLQTWINQRCWEIEYNVPFTQKADSPTREELLDDILYFPDYTTSKCGKYILIGGKLREV